MRTSTARTIAPLAVAGVVACTGRALERSSAPVASASSEGAEPLPEQIDAGIGVPIDDRAERDLAPPKAAPIDAGMPPDAEIPIGDAAPPLDAEVPLPDGAIPLPEASAPPPLPPAPRLRDAGPARLTIDAGFVPQPLD